MTSKLQKLVRENVYHQGPALKKPKLYANEARMLQKLSKAQREEEAVQYVREEEKKGRARTHSNNLNTESETPSQSLGEDGSSSTSTSHSREPLLKGSGAALLVKKPKKRRATAVENAHIVPGEEQVQTQVGGKDKDWVKERIAKCLKKKKPPKRCKAGSTTTTFVPLAENSLYQIWQAKGLDPGLVPSAHYTDVVVALSSSSAKTDLKAHVLDPLPEIASVPITVLEVVCQLCGHQIDLLKEIPAKCLVGCCHESCNLALFK